MVNLTGMIETDHSVIRYNLQKFLLRLFGKQLEKIILEHKIPKSF